MHLDRRLLLGLSATVIASGSIGCGRSESKQPASAPPGPGPREPALSHDASLQPTASHPADAAPAVIGFAKHITRTDLASTPTCVGFARDGRAAFVLTARDDGRVPSWKRTLSAAGAAKAPGIEIVVQGDLSEPEVQTRLAPLVARVNEFVDTSDLAPCIAATRQKRDDFVLTVDGHGVAVRLEDNGRYTVTIDGTTTVAQLGPQHEVLGVYASASWKGIAVVIAEYEGPPYDGLEDEGVSWYGIP